LWKGDVEAAQKQLALTQVRDANGLVTSTEVWILMLGRKFSEALRKLNNFPEKYLMLTAAARRKLSSKVSFTSAKETKRKR